MHIRICVCACGCIGIHKEVWNKLVKKMPSIKPLYLKKKDWSRVQLLEKMRFNNISLRFENRLEDTPEVNAWIDQVFLAPFNVSLSIKIETYETDGFKTEVIGKLMFEGTSPWKVSIIHSWKRESPVYAKRILWAMHRYGTWVPSLVTVYRQ